MKEETSRHPETGLFVLQSELTVIPAPGGTAHPTFSCSFSPGLPLHGPLNATPIKPHVRGEQGGRAWSGRQGSTPGPSDLVS